ncbi:hypothetical protein AB5J52_21665 [Streptomyces sp. R39]|uniref:Right-handed parallel beta-helix repeat-containing protein n=1 Tax=Streptomyces sp. R39 TaxID=3238631 RepID=A0AB39QTQ0_9ACTN
MRYIRFCSAAAAAAAIATGLTSGPANAADPDRVPCSGTALALAITNARNGETLDLRRDCSYHLMAALPAITRSLTIRGNGATIVRDGAATPAFRIFEVSSGGDLRLKELTVRGGYLPTGSGAGIHVNSGGGLRLSKVDVLDNTAANNGGGIAVDAGGSAEIKSSYVAFNNATQGGGLFTAGSVTTENSEFARNHARRAGGAVFQSGGMTFVGMNVIRRNTAAGLGGGIFIGDGSMEIDDSKITNNTAAGSAGGGIYNNANLKLVKSKVSGNVVGGTAGQGGGIYNTGTGVLLLKGTEVSRNSANGPNASATSISVGGGIYNNGGSVALDHSTVRDNASTSAPGGVFTTNLVSVTASKVTHNIPTNCSVGLVPGCTD